MQRTFVTLTLGGALLFALSGSAAAQGFSVNEHGTCSMARGGTGVALACADGSTINFNPSGIAGMTGMTFSAGATVIAAAGSFTDDRNGDLTELQNDPIPVPHSYFIYSVNDKLAAGFGFFVPYGLGTVWPNTFEGRFNGYDNHLKSMYFQPTLAYQPHPKIKIGAGFDVVLASIKLTQRIDLSEFSATPTATFGQLGIPFRTDFANALLEASGAMGYGGNFGITVEPADWIRFGARYLMRVKLDYEGTAEFTPIATNIILPPGNPIAVANPLIDETLPLPVDTLLAQQALFDAGGRLADQTVETSITMPDQATIGVAVDISESVVFLVDYQWMNWSVFDVLPIDFGNETTPDRSVIENYEDTHAIRFGLDWNNGGPLSVRGGYLYHNGAAPPQTVTPLLPEGARNEFTGGFGYKINDMFTVDLAYQYLKQNDRRGRVREAPGGAEPTIDLNSGLYSFNAHLFGLTLTTKF